MDRLKVGLIGAGHFGRFHALKLAAAKRVEFVGLADPDAERARTVAKEAKSRVLGVDEVLAQAAAVVILKRCGLRPLSRAARTFRSCST